MKVFRWGCWGLPLLFILMLSTEVLAGKKALIVMGVSEGETKNISVLKKSSDGIVEVLKTAGVAHQILYAGLVYAPNDAAKSAEAKAAVVKIRQIKPDLIFVLGDDTLKHIGALVDDIPIVFTYVYGDDPREWGLPKANISGVTRRSFAPDIFGLTRKLTGAQTVTVLGNASTMAGVRVALMSRADQLEKITGVKILDVKLCNTFEEWKEFVRSCPADFIYLTDTSMIIKDGKPLERRETTGWTVENSKVPVVAATDLDTSAGALFAILNDERKWGQQAGEMAVRILSGTPISEMPVESMREGALVINSKTAQKYRIDIPYEVLSSAAEIY